MRKGREECCTDNIFWFYFAVLCGDELFGCIQNYNFSSVVFTSLHLIYIGGSCLGLNVKHAESYEIQSI